MTHEDQQSIAAWADETFGDVANPRVLIDRARIELDELEEAVALGDKKEIGKETADVLILLYRLLAIHGLDVGAEISQKMNENRARQWLPKGDGTGSHIK